MKPPKHPNYFEGILQLRNINSELLNYVYKKIKKDNKVNIAKEKAVTNGVDLYLSSQRYLLSLGKDVKSKFHGILKTSKKLHTVSKSTGKNLYRVTVLFKAIKFKKGSIITLDDEDWKVIKIDKNATIQNLKSGKKTQYKLEVLDRYVR